ncbi:MAG: DUF433 domain-containing protein [Pyrinomonadaceae bacterium]|nr:DUF433 domain-containing protein [Pyrinomonadaceae bacterium]
MKDKYVTKLDNGAYRVADTRVSLDSVIYAFWDGETPETIARHFPALTLEQIYGAIAFYLANRAEIDRYMQEGDIEFEKLSREWRKKNFSLYEKLERARQELEISVK